MLPAAKCRSRGASMANTQKSAKPVAVEPGRSPDADFAAELCGAIAGRLAAIQSSLDKLVRVLEGQPSRATSPAAFSAAPRVAPRAPEPRYAPEVERWRPCGEVALLRAQEAFEQGVAIMAGVRGRRAVEQGGGLSRFIESHPALAEFRARLPAAPAPVDAPRLVTSPPERVGLRPNRGSRERSPTSGPQRAA